jgi:hypothetical protein
VETCSGLLARVADAESRALLTDAARIAHERGGELWLVGEGALALELGLPCDAWQVVLQAASLEVAEAACAAIREHLRRTPGRPLWLRATNGQLETPHVVAHAFERGDDFAARLDALDCAPLDYACEPLAQQWFDPHGVRAHVAGGALPDARCPALRAAGLAAWSGLRSSSAALGADSVGVRSGAELVAFARRRGAGTALAALGSARAAELGLLEAGDASFGERARALDVLAGSAAAWTVLAALFDPRCDERDEPLPWEDARTRLVQCGLDGEVRHAIVDAWRRAGEARRVLARARGGGFEGLRQSERLRIVRERAWRRVRALLPAWEAGAREFVDALDAFRAEFDPAELDPHPLLTAGDMQNARIPRGEPTRELLEEAFDLQLDGVLATRDAAVSWLRARSLELAMGDRAQLGGKMRRRKNASG